MFRPQSYGDEPTVADQGLLSAAILKGIAVRLGDDAATEDASATVRWRGRPAAGDAGPETIRVVSTPWR